MTNPKNPSNLPAIAAPSGALALPSDIAGTVQAALTAARSANTRKVYANGWRAFEAFCKEVGAAALPAEPATVVSFLASEAKKGMAVATLETRLAAISAAHRAANKPSPTVNEGVHMTLQGLRRLVGAKQRQAAPVTLKTLAKLVEALPRLVGADAHRLARDRAIVLVGYSAAMRRSELVALRWDDVQVVEADGDAPAGAVLTIRKSKTDQEAVGRDIGLPMWNDEQLCPVRALKTLQEAQLLEAARLGAEPPEHIFVGSFRRDGHMRPAHVNELLKVLADEVKLDGELFSGHSLRAGHVTEAFERGLQPTDIMAVTGHRSVEILLKYERRLPMRRGTAGKVGR